MSNSRPMNVILLLIIACSLTMTNCSTDSERNNKSAEFQVYLTDSKSANLPEPGIITEYIDQMQQITAEFGNRQIVMNTYIRSDAAGLLIIGMTEMGQELFELVYDGIGLNFTSRISLGKVQPEYMVMDIMIMYGERVSIIDIMSAAGLTFSERIEGETVHRFLDDGENRIIELTIDGDIITFNNFLRSYSYIIRRGDDIG